MISSQPAIDSIYARYLGGSRGAPAAGTGVPASRTGLGAERQRALQRNIETYGLELFDWLESVLPAHLEGDGGQQLAKLWYGDISGFPSHSEADMALAIRLARMTNGNPDLIDYLFRNSRLVREKWTERNDYRERTINRAIEIYLGELESRDDLLSLRSLMSQPDDQSNGDRTTGGGGLLSLRSLMSQPDHGSKEQEACATEALWAPDSSALCNLEIITLPAAPCSPIHSTERPWPDKLHDDAYQGLAGEVIELVKPNTEADPAAVLLSFLILMGSMCGRGAYFLVETIRHYLVEFGLLVGPTSKGRKGTSWGPCATIGKMISPEFMENRILAGLSSGEGVVWAVRDPITRTKRNKGGDVEVVTEDEGVADKRGLILESEFASVLAVMSRQGNTVASILRLLWDCSNLSLLTKNSPARSTGAHLGLVAHISKEELKRNLSATDSANGFGNRFLTMCVRRPHLLPEGGRDISDALHRLSMRLATAVAFGREPRELRRDDEARELWISGYSHLSRERLGMGGALLSRAEAHVMRLAAIFAVLDLSPLIRLPHLKAGLAVWRGVEQSVDHIFGDDLGDPVADELLAALRRYPMGLTRTEIRNLFHKHKNADQIGRALDLLARSGLARCVTEASSGGRKPERWYPAGGDPAT